MGSRTLTPAKKITKSFGIILDYLAMGTSVMTKTGKSTGSLLYLALGNGGRKVTMCPQVGG